MSTTDRDEQRIFEDEVRRIARELWPGAEYCGSRMMEKRERDGYFETEDCVHLIEATVSQSKEKAKSDIKKMTDLTKSIRSQVQHKAVKCWFITKHEPTAEQREVAKQHHNLVNALSFQQFQSKIIDAASYLNLRSNYDFGSVRDPATGTPATNVKYVPLDLLDIRTQTLWSIPKIQGGLLSGEKFVILGDYGAGKSMTLRELYHGLKSQFLTQQSVRFPVFINLRDHHGQTNPAEVLERHARNIGFPNPSHLVRAWRAGYVILLIDGFDEVATLGVQGLWRRLHDTRFRAMQATRDLIRSQPVGAGLILAGRAHFFDSDKERTRALGLSPSVIELSLNEFSDDQIQKYLAQCGLKGNVPNWLPSRPLLVGYLAARGMLNDVLFDSEGGETTLGLNPAKGWNLILDNVCAREAEIETGIDGSTIRKIIERLATIARSSDDGLGPLQRDQVIKGFTDICGYQPDEKGLVLLQRLPGLGIDRAEEGTRIFMDDDFADACRAGDVVGFVEDPYNHDVELFKNAQSSLGYIGKGVGAENVRGDSIPGKIKAALSKASELDGFSLLSLDLLSILFELGLPLENNVQIRDLIIPTIHLHNDIGNCSNLYFQDCYFSHIEIDPDLSPSKMPRFEQCYFVEVEGRSSRSDLPLSSFSDTCDFDKFVDTPSTTSAITAMDLPLGTRVMLTILKKVFIQSGSGRLESALTRGLEHNARRLVPDVLRLLNGENIIEPYRRGGLNMTIWIPNRSQRVRVTNLIESPHTSTDALLAKVRQLS